MEISEKQENNMSKIRIMKNLIVISIGFFLLFCAFQSLANLQSTMNSAEDLGVISQSVIYAALIISSLFLPKLIIKYIGCKWTIVLSICTYVPYIAANFYPSMQTFIPTAIILGIGGASLWSAKCTYLNKIASLYAVIEKSPVDVVLTRFFGIFFCIFQNTQIWGNLISYYVLMPKDQEMKQNVSLEYCGSAFCHESDLNTTNPNLNPPSYEQRVMLTAIYMSCAIFAAIVVAIFLDTLENEDNCKDNKESVFAKALATIRHLRKLNQLLLLPLTIFSGIEQAFILSDFTKAYVACAWGVYHVGFVFICYGIVDGILSYIAGRMRQYISRKILVSVGGLGNIISCILMFLWSPNPEQSYIFFIIVGVWGFSDAIWQTQVNALYGALFQNEAEAGFSNYRLWESVGFSIAFAYSSAICMALKIYILLGFLAVGLCGYFYVEYRAQK